MTLHPEAIDTIHQRHPAEQYNKQLGGIAMLLSGAVSILEVSEAVRAGQTVSDEQVQRMQDGFDRLTLKYPGDNN